MPTEKETHSGALWNLDPPKIIALVTLVAAVMVSSPHFTSPRPPVDPVRIQTADGNQRFYLSIQEDPLRVLDSSTAGKDKAEFNEQMYPPPPVSAVLAVMVPGGSSSEDHEARIRARQAVSASLMELDYGPDDPDHIGVWGLRLKDWSCLAIPFEHYHDKTTVTNVDRSVVVLWLNEDEFRNSMVEKLGAIRENAVAAHYALVGPYSSERLRQLLSEIKSTKMTEDRGTRTWNSIALALPRASSAALLGEADIGQLESVRASVLDELISTNSTGKAVFANAYDLVVNDAVLAHKAWHEFKSRGVDFDLETRNHLLIVSDATTIIGRSLPKLFSNELQKRGPNFPSKPTTVGLGQAFPPNLHVFSYTANLDGGRGGSASERSSAGAKNDGNKKEDLGSPNSFGGKGNPAFGANQMDSLERLAKAVDNLDSEMRLQNRGTIRGVIVGGGDIYDTLLVLRALRPVLPYAVFMTTELDARLWDPEVWSYTHNLVVVSGYGLSLNQRVQKRSLPFRDSRQTALFAATSASLTNEAFKAALKDPKVQTSEREFPVPHQVFEISRTGPRELTDPPTWNARLPIHPDLGMNPTRPNFHLYAQAILVILLVVGIGCLTVSPLQWLIRAKYEHLAQPLWLTQDDLGGNRGVWHLRNLIPQYKKQLQTSVEEVELIHTLEKELNVLTTDGGMGTREKNVELLSFSALDITKPDELVQFVRGESMQAVFTDLRAISFSTAERDEAGSGGSPEAETQPAVQATAEAGQTQTSLQALWDEIEPVVHLQKDREPRPVATPDLAFCLNNMMRILIQDAFWKPVEKVPNSVRRFNLEAWKTLSKYVGSENQSLNAESLNNHHSSLLSDKNRHLFVRQLVQAIFDYYLKPWSVEFWTSTRTLEIADTLNAKLRNNPGESRTVNNKAEFEKLRDRREVLTLLFEGIENLLQPEVAVGTGRRSLRIANTPEISNAGRVKGGLDMIRACLNSLSVGRTLTDLRLYRLWLFRTVLFVVLGLILLLTCYSLFEASDVNSHFLSGTSLAPTIFGLSSAILLVVIFGVESITQTKRAMLQICRKYRLPLDANNDGKWMGAGKNYDARKERSDVNGSTNFLSRLAGLWVQCRLPAVPEHQSPVVADKLWTEYRSKITLTSRAVRIGMASILYTAAVMILYNVFGNGYFDVVPLRAGWEKWVVGLSLVSIITFVVLAFTVLDSALICSWFIRSLTQGPTQYPDYTTKAIRDRYGLIDHQVVANYIDVKLIHEITEGIGRTLYYPAIVLSIILLSFNTITYTWPWPGTWYCLIVAHFAVAGAGVLALQKSARLTRDKCVEELDSMVNSQKLANSNSHESLKDALLSRAEDLVNEVRNLRQGAFAGFMNNPVIGASLLPVASVLLMQLLQRFLER